MKLAALSAAAALAAAAPAHAQPATTPESDGKSANTALALSLGGTAASVGLYLAGVQREDPKLLVAGGLSSLFTPALGHWYAGSYATPGMGMRVGGGLLIAVGFSMSFKGFPSEQERGAEATVGEVIGIAGIGLFAGGVIYDIATAGRAAKRWNAKHMQLAPSVVSSGAHTTMGIGLSGAF